MNGELSRWDLRCPAKLNWTLRVLGRRQDGFHELDSWFVGIGLYDILSLSQEPVGANLKVEGPQAADVPTDGRNLILQAEQAWRDAGGMVPPVSWSLHKQIPSAAGLGGGSSNAAAALRLLQHVGSCAPSRPLEQIALEIGSDVPFFLQDRSACRLGGRGERLLGVADAPPVHVVLAIPDFPVPTAQVFRCLGAPKLSSSLDLPVGTTQEIPFPSSPGPNDLLPAALRSVAALEDFQSSLNEVAPFHLSGSGGTFFHVAKDAAAADETAADIEVVCAEVCVVPSLLGPLLLDPRKEA